MVVKMQTALLTGSALHSPLMQQVIPMSSLHWTLENSNQSISIPGRVPSQAHLDLHAAGIIEDPYYGVNEFNLRWVAESNWTYSAPLSGL